MSKTDEKAHIRYCMRRYAARRSAFDSCPGGAKTSWYVICWVAVGTQLKSTMTARKSVSGR